MAHQRIVDFWYRLMRAARLSIETGETIRVMPAPRPSIVTAFDGTDLNIELPSGRVINYPGARLAANEKFANAGADIEFMDNARGKWKRVRAWHGTLVENVVQATARDLLAAAIARVEARWPGALIFHCHDEIVLEAPIGTIAAQDVLACLLEAPSWAAGLPLGGKVHVGPLYLEAPETAAPPPETINLPPETSPETINLPPETVNLPPETINPPLEDADQDTPQDDVVLACLDEMRATESAAPATSVAAPPAQFGELPSAAAGGINGFVAYTDAIVGYERGKILCPFHIEKTPSCQLYDDGHYHCFGCKAHGWIAEDIGELPAEVLARAASAEDDTGTLARAHELWAEAKPIAGTLAERYLTETRKLDLAILPDGVSEVLRFHPRCPFGANNRVPCLIALMRNPLSGAPVGLHRTALKRGADGRIDRDDRKMFGKAGVVQLWPINGNEQLIVGEGLETTLAAAVHVPYHGTPLTPAWSALTAGGLKCLPVLPGVSPLILLVDNDENGEGQRAAEQCRRAWKAAGRIAVPLIPKQRGWDFNDVVFGRKV